eukprot:10839876-Ditylum_brightwellii.AAC.1
MAAMVLTEAEFGYQVNLQDIAMLEHAKEDYGMDYEVAEVRAGLGEGFENTCQFKPMKCDEVMAMDKAGWEKAVEEEHQQLVTNKVWHPI